MNRVSLILFVLGLILIVAGFQGKLGAVIAAFLSPGDVLDETLPGGAGDSFGFG